MRPTRRVLRSAGNTMPERELASLRDGHGTRQYPDYELASFRKILLRQNELGMCQESHVRVQQVRCTKIAPIIPSLNERLLEGHEVGEQVGQLVVTEVLLLPFRHERDVLFLSVRDVLLDDLDHVVGSDDLHPISLIENDTA